MKALAVVPGTPQLRLVDRPEPQIGAPDEIKMRVLRVGICGTDREEASGGRALLPEGQTDLVIGHEMFGQVTAVGDGVTRVKVGDYAVFTVRRGCGKCAPCSLNRADMCLTGDYRERGIWGLDGYQAEFAVDREQYVVHVPDSLRDVGVLCEPMSVVEKAVDEAVRLQALRLPDAPASPNWLYGRKCLVVGLGPIGLLGALILRLRGAEVWGIDIVDAGSARPAWLEKLGGKYVDGRAVTPDKIDEQIGAMEVIVEAAGVSSLAFNLMDALAYSGVYVLTGIPGGERPAEIPADDLMRQMVLQNQVMAGSVNAARDHFQLGVDDFLRASLLFPGLVEQLITHRHPVSDFDAALHQHAADEIKVVIEWGQ